MLEQIFSMQNDLNIRIGRDTANYQQNIRDMWFFDYAFAFQQEIAELYNSIAIRDDYTQTIDIKNAKLEIIDAIHFITSMCLILNIKPQDVVAEIYRFNSDYYQSNVPPTFTNTYNAIRKPSSDVKVETIFGTCTTLWLAYNSMINNVAWKWWAEPVKSIPSLQYRHIIDRPKLVEDVLKLFVIVFTLARAVDMTPEEIFDIYKRKHQVNLDRQDKGYDVRTKTEADNDAIKQHIS